VSHPFVAVRQRTDERDATDVTKETDMRRPDSDTPTPLEMVEEVLELVTGLGLILLPLFILAVPGAVLLLPLAVLVIPLGLLVPPYLIGRAVWRRLR
jgi:hypothetical protein